MSNIAKIIEITAESPKSFEDAVERGVAGASKSLDQVQGAWVKEQKVVCNNGKITAYRVTMKVTFVVK